MAGETATTLASGQRSDRGIARCLKTAMSEKALRRERSTERSNSTRYSCILRRHADLGRRISELAVEWMQRAVDMYTVQDTLVSFGFGPHYQSDVIRALTLADVALSATHLTPRERERIRAQAAFLAYTLVRKDNWDPERGFSANPNMTTMVHAYIVAAAAFIPSHPHAATWAKQSLDELLRQLNEWSDENGGWLEAPHYALVAYDLILGAFIMARNSGFGDYVLPRRCAK